MSACPISPSMILIGIPCSTQVLARQVPSVDFPESTSPRMTMVPRVCLSVSAAFFQVGGTVDPQTCRHEPDSPSLASTTAFDLVSIGTRRPLAIASWWRISIGQPRIVAGPSLRRMVAGPSTRSVLSPWRLYWGIVFPPSEAYSIWTVLDFFHWSITRFWKS